MMWHTHAAIGAGSIWMLVPVVTTLSPSAEPVNASILTVWVVIGALMPDMDAAESKIKHIKVAGLKPLVPIAIVLHRDLGHRGLMHSLLGWGLWTLLILPLAFWIGWLPIFGLSFGYASHLAGDFSTKRGIPLLYPNKSKWHLLPKPFRITTGSQIEEMIFVLFAMLSMGILLESMGR